MMRSWTELLQTHVMIALPHTETRYPVVCHRALLVILILSMPIK